MFFLLALNVFVHHTHLHLLYVKKRVGRSVGFECMTVQPLLVIVIIIIISSLKNNTSV